MREERNPDCLGENSGDEILVDIGVGRKVGDGEAVVALKSGRVREREGWRWRAHVLA